MVEPIVGDAEFERSIPSLAPDQDSALDQPLESVTDFERRLAGDPATAAPGAAPVAPKPGAALPSADPELARPLPPLNQFDVRQVEFAAPAPDARSVETRFAVVVEGLEKPDAMTKPSLRSQFNTLSALRESKGKVANEAMLAARLTEDSKLLQRILQSEGWYDARVDTRIDHGDKPSAAPVRAMLVVIAGERYNLGTVTITAAPTDPPDLIADSLALKPGQPIIADRVQGAEANVAVMLPQHGYPFAEVGQRDVLLDPETHIGDYTLPVTVGPRGRFGAVTTTGKLAFDAQHTALLGRFKRGDLYDSRKVDDLRQALVATGLFSTVAVVPQRTSRLAADGTELITSLVTQQAGPPHTLAASAGYGTGQGLRVEGSWTHANFFPPEGALIGSAVAGTDEQSAAVTFRRSNAAKRDRTFQVTLQALHSNYAAFNAFTGQLSAKLSYDSTPLWQKPFTYAVGAEILGTVEEAYDFSVGARAKHRYLIGGLSGQVGVDRTDSLLNPTRGFRTTLLVQPEGSLSGSFTPYVRGQLDASVYHPFGNSFVLAARARIGSSANVDLDNLAPSRRFYAGGGGSVRGFGYQQLGPKSPDGRPIGGLSLIEGAAEARYRFGDYGIVGFVDVGQVYSKRVPSLSNVRAGVGIGGRFYTNFGPFRLDIATPIARQRGESRFNLYVSIGQAF
ncbi:MAG: BamA/TamA family outer membrane protein [Sphingomicrobium sp.]